MAHQHVQNTAENPSPGRPDTHRLALAVVLTGGFMVVEVVGGLLAGSLALLADAGHMLADAAALGMAWFAAWIAHRPPDSRRSYGYHRFQVLVAFVNGLALIVITAWITAEAFQRMFAPIDVLAVPMLVIASLGLAVNAAVFAVLHGGDRANLNIQGALLHVLSDLLGSVAAIIAALVIYATGWMPIDPLLSLLVAALILRSGWSLVRRSAHILLEGAPEAIEAAEIKAAIESEFPEIEDVHHVHAWSLSHERPLITLHACVREGFDRDQVLQRLLGFLQERFAIGHATVQIEGAQCAEHALAGEPHQDRRN